MKRGWKAAQVAVVGLAAGGLLTGFAQSALAGDETSKFGKPGQAYAAEAPGATEASGELPGGPWPAQCDDWTNGDTVRWCNDGEFFGIEEGDDRGTRLELEIGLKEPGGAPGENGTYGQSDWYRNGTNCYVSSFSDAGGGVSCIEGWAKVDDVQTDRENDGDKYHWWDMWWPLDPLGSSGRASIKSCLDIDLDKDDCTASILRGRDY